MVERMRGRAVSFSCDEEVAGLLSDPSVWAEVVSLASPFGATIVTKEVGDRRKLRELAFVNSEFRGKLEALLHPLVLRRLGDYLDNLADSVRVSLIEVPLLYEVDFPVKRDLDLVVAASGATQKQRLCERRGLDPAMAERILGSQAPMEEKMTRADIVVWNDGDRESLAAQIAHLVGRCEPLLN